MTTIKIEPDRVNVMITDVGGTLDVDISADFLVDELGNYIVTEGGAKIIL